MYPPRASVILNVENYIKHYQCPAGLLQASQTVYFRSFFVILTVLVFGCNIFPQNISDLDFGCSRVYVLAFRVVNLSD